MDHQNRPPGGLLPEMSTETHKKMCQNFEKFVRLFLKEPSTVPAAMQKVRCRPRFARALLFFLSVGRPQLVASDTFGGRQRSNACVRKVFEHVWNEVHGDGAHDPSFNWDDATNAMVGGDRKFGNWDDGAMAGTRRKFGLMI